MVVGMFLRTITKLNTFRELSSKKLLGKLSISLGSNLGFDAKQISQNLPESDGAIALDYHYLAQYEEPSCGPVTPCEAVDERRIH